jgi:hypothetical protein
MIQGEAWYMIRELLQEGFVGERDRPAELVRP